MDWNSFISEVSKDAPRLTHHLTMLQENGESLEVTVEKLQQVLKGEREDPLFGYFADLSDEYKDYLLMICQTVFAKAPPYLPDDFNSSS